MPLPLDPGLIRAEFPAFAEPDLSGEAFFDNAGGSYAARQVIDRLERYYRQTKVQPYGAYPASEAAGEAMDFAYRRLAAILDIPETWVHFGPSTSMNAYVLARAFAGYLEPGDAVIVTNQDHEANSGPWRRLADLGMKIREWQVNPQSGRLDLAGLDALLDDKVRLVAAPHCSNIVGEINPVAEIAARARAVGAVSVIDGVSLAPHGLPDVAATGADIYLFSTYKTYGPHLGVMAIRPDLARALPNQGHFFNDAKPRYRLTPAGPDHAQIAAAAGIADYLERVAEIAAIEGDDPFAIARSVMHAQEVVLMQPLLDWFAANAGRARLIGPLAATNRAPTFSLALGEPGRDVAARLARHGIMAGGGHFYAWRLIEALGIDPDHGVLRLSFVHYTAPGEIARLIAALDAELA